MKQAMRCFGSTLKAFISSSIRKKHASNPVSPLFDPPLILNDNLRFEANDYQLFMVPKHPEVVTKGVRQLTFNQMSTVMELHFLKKKFPQSESESIWKQSKAMRFKFQHLGKILDVGPGMSEEHVFGISYDKDGMNIKEMYQIKYNQTDRRIQFWLKKMIENIEKKVDQELFNTSISMEDFEIMQEIIKESLFDLSGFRLFLDLRCMQELQKVTAICRQKEKQFKEAEEYFDGAK